MGDTLHLTNHNFISSLSSSLCSLMTSSSMCDCTLVCSDGQVSSHKIILAGSSSFFSSVFGSNHHKHPLIYMRGVKMEQMTAVLHYIYQGNTSINQEDLSSFLQLAQDLQVHGLIRNFEAGDAELKSSERTKIAKKVNNARHSPTLRRQEGDIGVETVDKQMDTEKVLSNQVSIESEMPNKENIDMQESAVNMVIGEASDNNDEGVDPCKEYDRKFIPSQGKSKLDYVLEDVDGSSGLSHKIFPKVFCPVCKKMDGMYTELKQHMKAKREVQCENCLLFFSNCNTLKVHLDGRCKNMKKNN